MTDALYWQTSLNLNFNGDLTDISPTVKTMTANGGMAAGTAQLNIGTGTLTATAASSQYLSHAQHDDFDFGSGDFCVEFYWRPTSDIVDYSLLAYATDAASATADKCVIIDHLGATSVGGGAGKVRCIVASGSTEHIVYTNGALASGTWYHIAVVREGAALYIYLDGSQQIQSAAIGTDVVNTAASRTLRIGRYTPGSPLYANGYYDLLRITKGAARYTTDFTPPIEDLVAGLAGTSTAALTAPAGTMSALGGASSAFTAPMGQLSASGHDSTNERSFTGTAPMGTLSVLGGATATLSAPMGTLIASVTVPISVRAELVGPMGDLVASGTVGVSMRADLRLSSAGTIEAFSGGHAALEAPMGTLRAIAQAGVLAHFAGTAPMGSLTALATAGIVVRAELTAPMIVATPNARATLTAPMGFLTAYGRAVVTTTYEAYAVNLKPGEGMPHQVTRYTNYPFNQIVRFQGNYYGVASDGLYLLGGDTDYHAVIPTGPSWAVKTAITDFGSSRNKVTRETFLGARLGPTVSASVSIGEAADVTYAAQIVRGASAQNHRVKFGKGLEARYWSFGFSDTAGGEIDIDTLEFDARETARKL